MILGRIYLFGSLQLIPGGAADGAPLEIRSAKLQALLAYLSLHQQRPINRYRLSRALWPKANESSARRNLREYLYRARQTLGEFIPGASMIETEDNFITFNPPAECWIDLAEFERLTSEASQIPISTPTEAISLRQRATDLYRSDLLSNFYDDWVIPERERLQAIFIDNLAQLSQLWQVSQKLPEAITVTKRLLEYDPLREEDHRRLMELYLTSGDRARALQQYQLCYQLLTEELAAKRHVDEGGPTLRRARQPVGQRRRHHRHQQHRKGKHQRPADHLPAAEAAAQPRALGVADGGAGHRAEQRPITDAETDLGSGAAAQQGKGHHRAAADQRNQPEGERRPLAQDHRSG